MSSKLGAVKYGTEHGEPFLGRTMGHQRDYSDEVARDIDDEVRKLIEARPHRGVGDPHRIPRRARRFGRRAGGKGDAAPGRAGAHLRRGRKAASAHHSFDDFGERTPSDRPPIKTRGELAIERGEPWPPPVPEPAFKAAIAQASQAAAAAAADADRNNNGGHGVSSGRSASGRAARSHSAGLRCAGRLARAGWPPYGPAAESLVIRRRRPRSSPTAAAGAELPGYPGQPGHPGPQGQARPRTAVSDLPATVRPTRTAVSLLTSGTTT